MVLMLMASVSSLALADEESENEEEPVDDETAEEIEIMNNSLGCEIRLLQLEKAITKNLLKGEMIIDVLEGLDYNTSDLESILSEINLVLDEVKEADPNSSDAVEVFVGLKSDSKNLTKQFRDTLKDLLSDVKYKEIKEQVKEIASEKLGNYSIQIRNRIKQFNRNKIHGLYGIIGEANNSMVNQYMNGTMNLSRVKLQLNKMINMKIKEQKQEIFLKIKKEKLQKKNNATSEAENIAKNFSQMQQERLQKRLENANNSGNEKLIQRIQNQIENKANGNNAGNSQSENAKGNGKGKGK